MADSLDVFDRLRNLEFPRGLQAEWIPHRLDFLNPARTSRGRMHEHRVAYLKIWHPDRPHEIGWGEAAPLPGLSLEGMSMVEEALDHICAQPDLAVEMLESPLERVPAAMFALEQALLDLETGGKQKPFPSKFTDGRDLIPINGLIWMAQPNEMAEAIQQKIDEGYSCLKMKIGTSDRASEMELLHNLRSYFGPEVLEVRVDANGAFKLHEIEDLLAELGDLAVHSIEQPIAVGQWDDMADLCRWSPVPIALDEELIGLRSLDEKRDLVEAIMPQYLILKPSLLGGFRQAQEWIEVANECGLHWWATSALESNLGLNAIAQWVYTQQNPMPQGLGTGQLYRNNLQSPLHLDGPALRFNPDLPWVWPQ